MTLFGVGLLFIRNVWCLASNTTTIEGWEIERHENLVRRAKRRGGYLDGPDGIQMRLTHQEFPYDIGIFKNIAQGMTGLFIFWLFPFAPTASNESGLNFCTNGFDGRNLLSHTVGTPTDTYRSTLATTRSGPNLTSRVHISQKPWFHGWPSRFQPFGTT